MAIVTSKTGRALAVQMSDGKYFTVAIGYPMYNLKLLLSAYNPIRHRVVQNLVHTSDNNGKIFAVGFPVAKVLRYTCTSGIR